VFHQTLHINIDYAELGIEKIGSFQPTLDCYVPYNTRVPAAKRPSVIICPGSGYVDPCPREAEPIALGFMEQGFNAFVLWYSTTKEDMTSRFPGSLLELALSVATVREHAEEWWADPDKIMVCGFSAGGHLAASLGTLWNTDLVKDALGFYNGEHRPNGMILAYPVILSTIHGDLAHHGSFHALLGDKANDRELLELLSLERQVTDDTPPAFLWHTREDNAVPVRNSLEFATAMTNAGRPFEMHIFPYGPHGIGRGDDMTSVDGRNNHPECHGWINLAARWVKNL